MNIMFSFSFLLFYLYYFWILSVLLNLFLVEYRSYSRGPVPWIEVPEVSVEDGSLVASPGQAVEPGEGDPGGEAGAGLWAGVLGVHGAWRVAIRYSVNQ